MLRAYRYAQGRLVLMDSTSSAELAAAPVVWIDLLRPTADEDRRVESLLAISLPTREEMQEIEVSSRLYNEFEAQFMTLAAVTQIDADDPTLTPITFVLKGQTLITVRYEETRAFTNFLARSQKQGAVQCASGEQIMASLIEALSDRMADALEKTAADIDAISREVFRKPRDAGGGKRSRDLEGLLERIGRSGDLLTKVSESLVSVNRVLTYHTGGEEADKKASKEARARIKILSRDIVALTDQTAFLSDKVSFLLDATLGLINLQQSQIIKIVSVAAVVFLPPTLVASIYGMNFENMPELKWLLGYPTALFLMIISAVLPYLYFKRRGWL